MIAEIATNIANLLFWFVIFAIFLCIVTPTDDEVERERNRWR